MKLENCHRSEIFNLPSSFLDNLMLPPSSLFHVIFGSGFPFARHFNVAFPPSITVSSELDSESMILGGTEKLRKWSENVMY